VAHGVPVQTRGQVWWWVATGSSARPNQMIVIDVTNIGAAGPLRGGHYKWTGTLATASASVMHNVSLVASSEPAPYVMIFNVTTGLTTARTQPPFLYRVPFSGFGLELATGIVANFSAHIVTKAYGALGNFQILERVALLADALTGGNIQVAIIGSTGASGAGKSIGVGLDAAAGEAQVFRVAGGLETAEVFTWQLRIGDPDGDTNDQGQWNLLRIYIKRRDGGPIG
jgi:hypothetical protein